MAALLGVVSSLISGCGAQQRAAENLIDPRLRSEGVLVERQRGVRDLELGRYRVEGVVVEDQDFDGHGPLAPNDAGRTRPTQQQRLSFSLVGGATPWTAECVGQHRQPPDHDLAAVADELRDEVAVHCQLTQLMGAGAGEGEGEGQRWVLRLEGDLGQNVFGQLHPASDPDAGLVVEVVMWHRLWNVTRRRLPATLALIHGGGPGGGPGAGDGTQAALILDTPERAWLAPDLDDAARERDLIALLALRLLPLGFDG